MYKRQVVPSTNTTSMSPARPFALLIVSSLDAHAISLTVAPGNAAAKSAYVVGPDQPVKLRKLTVPVLSLIHI